MDGSRHLRVECAALVLPSKNLASGGEVKRLLIGSPFDKESSDEWNLCELRGDG